MFEVRVEADFAAAHFLQDYHGKCENLHGHNYRVFAHVRGTELDEGGMLFDFTILKRNLRAICGRLDHSHLNELVDEQGNSVFNQNPSAERIAQWIFSQLQLAIDADGGLPPGNKLYAVDVFETDTSRARYICDES